MSFNPEYMDMTNNFIRNLENGQNADAFLEKVFKEEKENLDDVIRQISKNLKEERKKVENAFLERIDEAKKVDVFQPASDAINTIDQRIQELSSIQETLQVEVENCENTLLKQKNYLFQLENELGNMQSQLKIARHSGFANQDEMLYVGGEFCKHIGTK